MIDREIALDTVGKMTMCSRDSIKITLSRDNYLSVCVESSGHPIITIITFEKYLEKYCMCKIFSLTMFYDKSNTTNIIYEKLSNQLL